MRIVAAYRDRHTSRLERLFSHAVWLLVVFVVLGGLSMRGVVLVCMSIALITLLGMAWALIRDARLTMVVAEMVALNSPTTDAAARPSKGAGAPGRCAASTSCASSRARSKVMVPGAARSSSQSSPRRRSSS